MSVFGRDSSVPMPALLRRFALICLGAVLVFSAVLFGAIRRDEQARLDAISTRENSRIGIAKALMMRELQAVDSDLRIAASLPVLRSYLDSGNPRQRDAIATLFQVWAREARRYDQLRYIDASGQEIVRVNYNDGQPAIVPPELLQNKAARYFFNDTLKLQAGQVYVSPLDLNIEQRRVEVPFKPMIRFGTPVFDSAGNKKGMLLFNYLADRLLTNFRETMAGNERNAMLLNRDGYWLSNSSRGDEWGFMLGATDRTFGHDYPDAWRVISGIEEGMLSTPNGLFFYASVSPLAADQQSSSGSALAHMPSAQALTPNEYSWKIVSFIPSEVIAQTAVYNQPGARILLTVIYLMLATGAWAIANSTLSRKLARDSQAESKERYDQLVRNLPVGIYLFRFHADGSMGFEYVSPVFCQILGLTAEEVQRDAAAAFARAHPDDVAELSRANREAAATLKPFRWEGRFVVRGETRWIRISSDLAPQSGEGSLWSGVISDITERRRAAEALQRSSEEIEDLYDHAPCGYHSLDTHGLIVRINSTALEWLGYKREEVVGRMHIDDMLTPASRKVFLDNFPAFKESGNAHDLELELKRKDGSLLPVLLNATAIRDAEGRFVMSRSTMFDITARKVLEKELERQAHIDVLTGLHNRRHFFELAEHELSRAKRHDKPLSALMLDVDHFKICNDTYGHQVGDQVLQKLAEVGRQVLRDIDLLGRIGGEEFAVLLPETDAAAAFEVAERLRQALAEAAVPHAQGGPIHFTVSVGIAHLTANDAELADLLRHADTALYAAKNAGRNCVCNAAGTPVRKPV